MTRRRREHELSDFVENAPMALHWVSQDGTIVWANKAELDLLGYSRDEYVGRHIAEFYADKRAIGDILSKLSANIAIHDCEARLRCKDGSIKHVLLSSNVLFEDGKFVHTRCFTRDITERKRAEEALRESEATLRSFFDSTDMMMGIVQVVDEDILHISDNEATSKFFGMTPDAMRYRLASQLGAPAEHVREWVLHYRECERAGHPIRFEYLHHAPSGPRWLSATVSHINRTDSGASRFCYVVEDITDRKRTEGTLEALYRASLEIQAPLGLKERLNRLLQTAQTVLELERVNILLADPGGAMLQAVASLGVEDPLDAIRVPTGPAGGGLAQAYRTQQMVVWDGRSPVPEGLRLQPPYDRIAAFRSQVFANVPLVVQGRAIGVLGADRKRSRRPLDPATLELLQLFAAQAAVAIQNARLFEQVQAGRERLQSLSSRLVTVQEAERRHLARELHDQIGQVLTGLKLALDMSTRLPPDRLMARMGEAQRSVSELMVLVRDLSLDLRPAMLDDLGLLPALLWYFERYTAQTGVKVALEHCGVDRRVEPEIETAVYRIVQEALTNVARHAKVSEAAVRLWADQQALHVRVGDRGTGFDPIAALAVGGTGGLSGMRERAQLLGGTLAIESSPGAGACLTAEFPLGTERTLVRVIDLR